MIINLLFFVINTKILTLIEQKIGPAIQPSINPQNAFVTTGTFHLFAIRSDEIAYLPFGFFPLQKSIEEKIGTTTNSLQNELDVLNNETKLNCNAERTNSFYEDLGALFCLHTKGDVAILGLKNLNG